MVGFITRIIMTIIHETETSGGIGRPSASVRPEDTSRERRKRLGIRAGLTGLTANLMLSAVKISAAIATGSVAISADGVHNLSDAGAAVVILIGFLVATKAPDKEHPYGYGRMEYICGFVVAGLVLFAGFETGYASMTMLSHRTPLSFGVGTVSVLVFSLVVNLGLCWFNNRLNKTVRSTVLDVAAVDYLADMGTTVLILLSLLLSSRVQFPVDGAAGLLVSAAILWAGWRSMHNSIRLLLGTKPDPSLMATIAKIACAVDGIADVHNMVIHDYGPTALFASFHAVVEPTQNMVKAHDIICRAQDEIFSRVHAETVIHLDFHSQK